MLLALAFCPTVLHAESHEIALRQSGDLVNPTIRVDDGDTVRFCIADEPYQDGSFRVDYWFELEATRLPLTTKQPKTSHSQNQPRTDLDSPEPLVLHACSVAATAGETVRITRSDTRMRYTLTGPSIPLNEEDRKEIERARHQLDGPNDPLRDTLESAQQRRKAMQKTRDIISAEIDVLKGSANPQLANELLARLSDVRQIDNNLATIDAEIDAAQRAIDARTRLLALESIRVFRDGTIIIGPQRRIVFYRLMHDGSPDRPVYLERIGEFPLLQKDDDLVLVITNAHAIIEPTTFILTSSSQVVAPPPPPVRPSMASALAFRQERPSSVDLSFAYKDVALPLGRPLKANEVLTLTVTTNFPAVTSDKTTEKGGQSEHEVVTEKTTVKVLDAAEMPQVHDLYQINIVTGVVVSNLRNPTFTKVKQTVGVPAIPATDTTPAAPEVLPTFDVITDRGSRRYFPVTLFSVYYTRRDTQLPIGWIDFLPVPAVGFSLTSPASDFFGGFSIEPLRNVQIVAGRHWGKVTARGPSPIDESTSDAAPNTVERFQSGWFAGATFNIAFVGAIFK